MKTDAAARVPASTSNLGPGFDSLGVALNLYNRVRLRVRSDRQLEIVSPIVDAARSAALDMIAESARAFCLQARQPLPGLDVEIAGDVPVARGLGSSVTLRLGVAAALNEIFASPLSPAALLNLVAQLEHHPDNAAPALRGGFAAALVTDDGAVRSIRFDVPERCKFVALVPRFEISTEAARRLVPDSFSTADAVRNLSRASLITAAFASGRFEELAGAFDDRFHQPHRQKLIPELSNVIRAGESAGAVGGWLSGSGSTIICLALRAEEKVAAAMQSQLPNSDTKILQADNEGLRIER